MFLLKIILVICAITEYALASLGDRSPFFQKCTINCISKNCTDRTKYIDEDKYSFPVRLLWSCAENCGYNCMWTTVASFQNRQWDIPQFYGKWPFVRLWGIQEPASCLFSILNLVAHYKLINVYRKSVRSNAPYYWLWHFYALISCHAWIWSSIFHARDTPFTEIMDYICAFSIIMVSFFVMSMRTMYNRSSILKLLVAVFSLSLFLNHSFYLQMGSFDYQYNLMLNIAVAGFTCFSWIIWSYWKRKTHRHAWKCSLYIVLVMLTTVLEIFDFHPIFWIFDAHSLWHLSTVPVHYLFYQFMIDDSKFLKKELSLD